MHDYKQSKPTLPNKQVPKSLTSDSFTQCKSTIIAGYKNLKQWSLVKAIKKQGWVPYAKGPEIRLAPGWE